MVKKILCACLVACMLLGLAACGAPNTEPKLEAEQPSEPATMPEEVAEVAQESENAAVVKTQAGLIEGAFSEDGQVVSFLGVPYAQPPVGEKRWKAPVAVEPWAGILSCQEFGNSAPQGTMTLEPGTRVMCYGQEYILSGNDPVNEDCLYLNVWKPSNTQMKDMPVLVIVHGGSFTGGSGRVPVLNGENMAKDGVIVVTINYRVGIFGFLAHPELCAEDPNGRSGNYGIMDQIAALQWVRDNIAAFGGDPAKVTVAGESAGAWSVSLLCQTPETEGLFSQAIAMSGALMDNHGMIPKLSMNEMAASHQMVLESVGLNTLEQLRNASCEELMAVPGFWAPVCDNMIWMEDTQANLRDIPLLLGNNSDEGNIFVAADMTKDQFADDLKLTYGDMVAEMEAVYCQEGYTMPEAVFAERRDRYFAYPMYRWVGMHLEKNSAPVYQYYFSREMPEVGFGAFHSSELEYFYNNMAYSDLAWEVTDYGLCKVMTSYLLNFLHTGDPNGAGLPEWEPYKNQNVMGLGDTVGMISQPHMDAMEAMDRCFAGK